VQNYWDRRLWNPPTPAEARRCCRTARGHFAPDAAGVAFDPLRLRFFAAEGGDAGTELSMLDAANRLGVRAGDLAEWTAQKRRLLQGAYGGTD